MLQKILVRSVTCGLRRFRFYNELARRSNQGCDRGLDMGLLIGTGILFTCGLAAWVILRRPILQIVEDVHVDHARALFHQRREWLEARFVSALARTDPAEGQRWENAQWHDEVLWARDRQTSPAAGAWSASSSSPGRSTRSRLRRHATALFEYRKGRWYAEGQRLDETRPDEAVGRNQRFEAVVVTQPHPRRVG